MATNKAKAVTKPPARTNKEKAEHRSKLMLRPSVNAMAVVAEYGKEPFGEQDLSTLMDQLSTKFDQVKNGDLQHCEEMLVGQAYALQTIFVNLSRRAIGQGNIDHFDTFLRLALKAQNQSRMTLETLAVIKNPPVVFAKQANIAHGHQQVNNGTPAPAHAGKNINQQNELLEVQHGSETLDTSATRKTIRKDKAMATVDKVNGRTDTRRKG